jgi:N4-gp56 family major capsid protein
MAVTSYGVNNALAVKLWSKKLAHEALKETFIFKFIGDDENSVIQIKEETSKSPGDRITVGLRMQLSGDGVSGDGTLEGNEEALTTYTDNVLIDQLRHAVRSGGKMSEQRVPFSVREEARMGLQDWFAGRMDVAFFNQCAGVTTQADLRYTGSNATVAPSSNNVIYAGGATAEGSHLGHHHAEVQPDADRRVRGEGENALADDPPDQAEGRGLLRDVPSPLPGDGSAYRVGLGR